MKRSPLRVGDRIVCDNTLTTDLIEPASIDLAITSPPYNFGKPYNADPNSDRLTTEAYEDFTVAWLQRVAGWLKPQGRLAASQFA